MTLSTRVFIFILAALIFIILAEVFQLKMFNENIEDGFYSQINFISTSIESSSIDVSPLFLIHAMRLLAVLPFFICDALGLPSSMEAISFLFYILPFVRSSRSSFLGYLPIIFLLLPFLFSYRAVLGMIGMLYLYICLFYEKGNYRMLIASAIFANLSSGIVLSWVIAVLGSYRYVRFYYRHLMPIFLIVILGFLGSMVHKYEYMFSASGAEEHGTALERSTLYVSFVNEQYARFGVYIIVVLLVCAVLALLLLKSYFSGRKWMFFVGAVPTIFFEGLGLVSYLCCMLIFFYNDISIKIIESQNKNAN